MELKLLHIIAIMLNLSFSFHAQEKKNIKMKKFDTTLFDKLDASHNIKDEQTIYKIHQGDLVINLIGRKNFDFIEKRYHRNHKNLTEILVYDKDNLTLKSSKTLLLNMAMGITKIYNDKGEVISETNEDIYPFTVTNLIEVAKTRYGIDLTKERLGLTIGYLDEEDGSKSYFMRYPTEEGGGNIYNFVRISTQTGQILFETSNAHDLE